MSFPGFVLVVPAWVQKMDVVGGSAWQIQRHFLLISYFDLEAAVLSSAENNERHREAQKIFDVYCMPPSWTNARFILERRCLQPICFTARSKSVPSTLHFTEHWQSWSQIQQDSMMKQVQQLHYSTVERPGLATANNLLMHNGKSRMKILVPSPTQYH